MLSALHSAWSYFSLRILALCLSTTWLILVGRVIAVDVGGMRPLRPIAILALWGLHAIGQLAVAGIVFLVWLMAKGVGHIGKRHEIIPWTGSLLAGFLAAVVFFLIGTELSSGPWISQQDFAWAVRWGFSLAGALGFAISGFAMLRFPSRAGETLWRGLGIAGGFAVVSLTCLISDALVLPGLYFRFHLLLYGIASVSIFIAALRLLPDFTRLPKRLTYYATIPALGWLVVVAGLWIDKSQATRSELVMRSPISAYIMSEIGTDDEYTYLFDTLKQIEQTGLDETEQIEPRRGLIDSGDDWNVILMVIDALRADALPPARGRGQEHATEADTPFLNQWIAKSFRFQYAYSHSSTTQKSMPPMFRSRRTFEYGEKIGLSLPTYMSRLGRTPIAVVNNIFIEPRDKITKSLLNGFEHVDIYEKNRMHEQVDKTLDLVNAVRERPFFAWLHFYCMHSPGFDNNRLLTKKDGSGRERYRRSLRWMDGQLRKLFEGFERLGIMDRTIVIFTADHGESLGDNNFESHGAYVFEEEVRVPLLIRVPGYDGRDIREVVGTIDIVPTIADLLGAPENKQHIGKSLVPLMIDTDYTWDREYYMEKSNTDIVGVVKDRTKLIYRPGKKMFHRFNLHNDPKEDENLFNPKSELDRELLRRLVRVNPGLFKKELKKASTQNQLHSLLGAADDSTSYQDLSFLLRLAALGASEQVLEQTFQIFAKTKSNRIRLLIVEHMFATDVNRWSNIIDDHIKSVAGTDRELEFVRGLALQGQPKLVGKNTIKRFRWWVAKGDPSTWEPWLLLVRNWGKLREKHYAPLLTSMLERCELDTDAGCDDSFLVELMLKNVVSIRVKKGSSRANRLAVAVLPLLNSPEILVQIAAYKALAHLGENLAEKPIEAKLDAKGQEVRVRQAAMNAYAALGGERAVRRIVEHGRDLPLTLDAIKLLSKIGSLEGVPFLEKVARKHYNGVIRSHARAALRKIKHKNK
ncbi:MAG: sulfatase-like hydrolase/transferase [Proteobacteria bacterium]|nr:sulfatase-like hydrolase/transferase [Pseudomonadota bacterium]